MNKWNTCRIVRPIRTVVRRNKASHETEKDLPYFYSLCESYLFEIKATFKKICMRNNSQWALVNTVMNLQVRLKADNLLAS
jgi:hypothetical protein